MGCVCVASLSQGGSCGLISKAKTSRSFSSSGWLTGEVLAHGLCKFEGHLV